MLGFWGKKLGMISIFDKNKKLNSITLVKLIDSYIFNYDLFLNKILTSCFKKNINFNFDFYNFNFQYIGDLIFIDFFYINQKLKLKSFSIGKGFSGTVKKYNFKINNRSHGNSKSHKKPGSIGMCQDPGRVFLGKKLPGQLGFKKKTLLNLKLIKIDFNNKILYIKGSIPGKKNKYIYIWN